MQIPSLIASPQSAPAALDAAQHSKDADLTKASQQFESILLRQFLSESMKSLLSGGEAGQVYGYMLTDSLANSLSEGGGMGLSSVLQAQLGGHKK